MPENMQGSGSEARLLADERFLRKIAYMYYEDGYSQETIAEMEFCCVCRIPGQARVLLLYPALVKRLSNTYRYYIRIALTCFSPALSCYGCDFY